MILVVDNKNPNLKYLISIIEELGYKPKVIDQSALFNSFAHHKPKGIILSGGFPDLDTKIYVSQIRANLAVILNFDCPVLGICEGHQIIAEAFGGDVLKSKNKILTDNNRIRIVKRNKLFTAIPKEFEARENHHRYVKDLPHTFEISATSNKTTVEAFAHKHKPIFGVQFHPERSGDHGKRIIENFLRMCK